MVQYLLHRDVKNDLTAFYSPDDDVAFQNYILPLGVEKVPGMIQRIQKNEFAKLFMPAVGILTKSNGLKKIESDASTWLQSWDQIRGEAKARMQELKQIKSIKDESKKAKTIKRAEELGLFAVAITDSNETDVPTLQVIDRILSADSSAFATVSGDLEVADNLQSNAETSNSKKPKNETSDKSVAEKIQQQEETDAAQISKKLKDWNKDHSKEIDSVKALIKYNSMKNQIIHG